MDSNRAATAIAMVALFVSITGVGWAVSALPKNSVKSKQIKDGQVKSPDVADNGLTGTDIDELTLDVSASAGPPGARGATGPQGATGAQGIQGPVGPADGPAGGDLSGTFPNPLIAADAVTSPKVGPDALSGEDINEATLSASILQRRVSNACAAGSSIRSIDLAGDITCETDDTASGAAGGDLDGTYPNPTLRAAENFRFVGGPGEPVFKNGWVNAGVIGDAFYKEASFYKDRQGVVHLQGSVKSGTVNATIGINPLGEIFTMPAGYRPCAADGKDRTYIVPSGTLGAPTVGEVLVSDFSGTHVVAAAGSNARLSLDGITWRADGC